MPKVTVLPHPDYLSTEKAFDVPEGTSICDVLLEHGVDLDHACGKVGACTTCHVIVRRGFGSLTAAKDNEEDMLDRA